MLDLVKNPNCQFSHAQAHVFCFAKYTCTRQSLIALSWGPIQFSCWLPIPCYKTLIVHNDKSIRYMLYIMDFVPLKCTCIYKLKIKIKKRHNCKIKICFNQDGTAYWLDLFLLVYLQTLLATTEDDITSAVEKMRSRSGPCLLEVKVAKGARPDLGRPKTTPVENKLDFMKFLSDTV